MGDRRRGARRSRDASWRSVDADIGLKDERLALHVRGQCERRLNLDKGGGERCRRDRDHGDRGAVQARITGTPLKLVIDVMLPGLNNMMFMGGEPVMVVGVFVLFVQVNVQRGCRQKDRQQRQHGHERKNAPHLKESIPLLPESHAHDKASVTRRLTGCAPHVRGPVEPAAPQHAGIRREFPPDLVAEPETDVR